MQVNEKLANLFEDFAANLRKVGFEDDVRQAGDGEYDDGVMLDEDNDDDQDIDDGNVVKLGQAPVRDNTEDGKIITMKSGELRKVINSYRTLVRYAREGQIPDQDTRFQLHQAVRAVKHLIRKPRRHH